MSILKALTFKIGMHGVGFEPTRSKTLGLESNPLDHSGIHAPNNIPKDFFK